MRESQLSADLAAVAEMMRRPRPDGHGMSPAGCNFIAETLDQLVVNARALEDECAREKTWRIAADARVAALTTPDHLRAVETNLAIVEGRRAGKIIDLRPVLQREWGNRTSNAVADAERPSKHSSDGKDYSFAAVASDGRDSADFSSDGGNGDAA